jgi:hypothetical protein
MDGASSNPPGGSGTPPAPGTCQADVKGFIQPIISAAMQRGIKDVSPLLQSETATISEVITAMQTYKRTIDKDLATLNNPKKWPSSCATNSEFKNEMKIFSAAYKVMFNFYNNTIKFLNKYRCITVKAANILLQNRATQDFIDFEALMAKFGTDITPIYNSWEPMMRKYNLTMN